MLRAHSERRRSGGPIRSPWWPASRRKLMSRCDRPDLGFSKAVARPLSLAKRRDDERGTRTGDDGGALWTGELFLIAACRGRESILRSLGGQLRLFPSRRIARILPCLRRSKICGKCNFPLMTPLRNRGVPQVVHSDGVCRACCPQILMRRCTGRPFLVLSTGASGRGCVVGGGLEEPPSVVWLRDGVDRAFHAVSVWELPPGPDGPVARCGLRVLVVSLYDEPSGVRCPACTAGAEDPDVGERDRRRCGRRWGSCRAATV
jgi:hypothetical protein